MGLDKKQSQRVITDKDLSHIRHELRLLATSFEVAFDDLAAPGCKKENAQKIYKIGLSKLGAIIKELEGLKADNHETSKP